MSFDVGSNTAGMMNKGVNLYDKTVELTKKGTLTEKDINTIEALAKSDGNYTGVERVFVDSLKTSGGRSAFVEIAKEAKFTPNSFSWNVQDAKTTINSSAGNKIELIFSDAPSASKEIKGDIASAKDNLTSIIPEDKRSEWEQTNKNNVADVKSFIDGLKLSPDDKIKFVQNYMTANFNHPGVDIKWNGSSLQDAIDTVPTDDKGRKYLDCEGFAKLSETLLEGSGKFTTLGVASGSNGDKRDHQIGVQRNGNDAYVISNNEIKKVVGGASKSDDDLLKETYPDFKNVIEDKNGAMKADTGNYEVGQTLNSDDGSSIKIESIDTATKMSAILDDGAGNKYHVKVIVDEKTADYKSIPDFKAGDQVTTSMGVVINFNGNNTGVATLKNGNKVNITASVDPVTGEPSFQ